MLVAVLLPLGGVASGCDVRLVDTPTTTTVPTVPSVPPTLPPGVVSGRPLRRRGKARTARSRVGDLALTDRQALSLPLAERTAIGRTWRRAAEFEHASVISFLDIAHRLERLHAPAALVARVEQAAADEMHHAELCFGLAGRYLGLSLRPGRLRVPLRLPRGRRVELENLAAESVRDGMYNEGVAAWLALHAGRHVTDSRVREVLQVIAADEAGHAQLSADIVGWCIAAGGVDVELAVQATAATMPEIGVDRLPAGVNRRTLAEHGVIGPDDTTAMALADIRASVLARCDSLVWRADPSIAA
jgi:hypothetical protein